ncbi:MAG: NAD(P)-binding domain-containing protein [Myxococcota bacterium]
MDYLVIGAGPAGLQLGYYFAKAGRDYQIVEAGSAPGTFFRSFPRHRRLISINKRYTGSDDAEFNLRTDWNSLLCDEPSLRFTNYSERYFPEADDLLRYLADFADTFRLRINYGTRITRIEKNGCFRAHDQDGNVYESRCIIVATGVSKAYIPPIPGIESAELYESVNVDPRDFVNQRVLVIGKGNSGFETADNLMETAAVVHVAGPSGVRLAWKTHYVGHLRAVNNNFLDTYQLKSQNAVLDGTIERIEHRNAGYFVTVRFSRANEVIKGYRYDRVIVCTGFRFDASIFDADCRPELVHKDRFPLQTSSWESANVPGLFFAGTLMQVRDFKKSTSGFIHGFRYGVRALHRILETRYHDVAWPRRALRPEPAALAEAVLARVSRSSALWQLFAFMADLVVVGRDGSVTYCEEVPLDYAHEDQPGRSESYFTISLEYGPDHDQHDPFDISFGRIRQSDAEQAHHGRYLHPVVRHFRKGTLLAEHHMAENLENDWTGETTHRDPLRSFFARQLAHDERPMRLLSESV